MTVQASRVFPLVPITAAVTSAVTTSPPALAQQAALEEVIVTARKRTESVQDIPASIQALSGDDLKEMGARAMSDYTRFVSSVDVIDYGNGASNIVFRGATVDGGGSYIAQSTSSVYLDEISITSTGSQPSVAMVDIARVEALAGPQGTIYGSDAQAGTMRIITNKPQMNQFEVVLDGGLRDGSEGEASYDGSIVMNLPLMEDTLALRVAAFGNKEGGFVDNVLGHTPDTSVTGVDWPSGFGDLDNSEYVEDDWNDSEVMGWRAALRWDINEDWSATLSALHQETDGGAYSFYDPYVGDLEVVRFFDDYVEDEYDLYSLTIEADLGFAQLVSATSYYDREIESLTDITAYQHYWSGIYCQTYDLDPSTYYWYYGNPDGSGVVFWPVYCLAPTVEGDYLTTSGLNEQQERFTQEIRLSASGDTLDWLAGIYYEDSTNAWQNEFASPSNTSFQDSIALDYWEWARGETFPNAKSAWYSDSHTDWDQKALFGEVVWHVTDRMDVTLGGRYFDRENVNLYFVERGEGNPADDYVDGVEEHKGSETEFVPKIAVSYDITDDIMGYALWTEGYRPGGTNRSRGEPFFPTNYFADKMTNYEAGIKSTLFDGAGRANLTVFYMDWEDYQIELVDPSSTACDDGGSIAGVCGQPWQAVVGNAGEAHILGVSGEFDWAVTNQLTMGFKAEWIEAENDTTLDLSGDGTPDISKGQLLPITPEWNGSAYANYEWPIEQWGEAIYARLQWSYRDETLNRLEPYAADGSNPNPQLVTDSSNIGDFMLGMRADTWDVSLFVNNITDERAVYTKESGLMEYGAASVADGRAHTQKNYVNRPREYGIRFSKRWGD